MAVAAAVVAGPLVDLADGRGVQLRDVELVGVEHPVEGAVEGRIGLQEARKITQMKIRNSNSGTGPGSENAQQIVAPIAVAGKRSQDSHSVERF